jgi:aromatic ring-opening dioxygenase catalytic subunit (LigB family)
MDWSLMGEPADAWDKTAAWLRGIAATLPSRPTAIVVVSGHWEEDAFTAASVDHPSMIYDYTGFPKHTYELQYPAPGSQSLAARIVALLSAAGLPARTDTSRGFDHGVFIPFLLAFPDADIPVVPLSLKTGLDPAEHLAAGKALAVLRDEGVLIIGSGMSYHNMHAFRTPSATAPSKAFDDWLTLAIESEDHESRWQSLTQWSSGPSARNAHPREEHLLPLMIAAGAASDAEAHKVFSDVVMRATISAFQFG